jgi:antitoxin (DNA-binding transcriptional repressor) of toxin-antitoxin stability system
MSNPQTVTATEARNNFFSLIDQSMFDGKSFIVEKNGRPWAELSPPQALDDEASKKNQMKLLEEIRDFSRTLPKMKEGVVETLRRLRRTNV